MNLYDVVRRRLDEQSSNLAAAPARGDSPAIQIIALPSTRSSGSFPAVPKEKREHSLPPVPSPAETSINELPLTKPNPVMEFKKTSKETSGSFGNMQKYIIGILSAVLVSVVALALFFIFRIRTRTDTSDPWKTGLSGQLQKAFVTGNLEFDMPQLLNGNIILALHTI